MFSQYYRVRVPNIEKTYERIDRFIELWSAAATDEEKNKALKQLVDIIIYNRDNSRIKLTSRIISKGQLFANVECRGGVGGVEYGVEAIVREDCL